MTEREFGHDEELARLARKLGEREAAGVDPTAMAGRVGARLREPAPARRPLWMRTWVPLAAAATIILAVGIGLQPWAGDDVVELAAVPAEIAELETDELEAVLDSLELDVPVSELVTVGLYELTEDELSTLLETMEG